MLLRFLRFVSLSTLRQHFTTGGFGHILLCVGLQLVYLFDFDVLQHQLMVMLTNYCHHIVFQTFVEFFTYRGIMA